MNFLLMLGHIALWVFGVLCVVFIVWAIFKPRTSLEIDDEGDRHDGLR